mmetsp:Transcript_24932/g.49881  ORF Transcript_24932/g.49881 Transcript_24932/m.49881 type:complete len:96 (-) Transcript_24932:795-1082(-)
MMARSTGTALPARDTAIHTSLLLAVRRNCQQSLFSLLSLVIVWENEPRGSAQPLSNHCTHTRHDGSELLQRHLPQSLHSFNAHEMMKCSDQDSFS